MSSQDLAELSPCSPSSRPFPLSESVSVALMSQHSAEGITPALPSQHLWQGNQADKSPSQLGHPLDLSTFRSYPNKIDYCYGLEEKYEEDGLKLNTTIMF